MAGSFPTLKSGNTVFYPLQDTHSFGTSVIRFMDDSEQRWRARNMLRRFKLVFRDINAYDAALVFNFLRSQFGRFDGTWDLTIGSETHEDLAFDTDVFQMTENKRNRLTFGFDVVQLKSAAPTIPTVGSYFPQINSSGILTALPYTSEFGFKTSLIELETGARYAYKWRTDPLGRYVLNLPSLSDDELAVVQEYFYGMEGRKGEFGILDPGGNLVTRSDDFSHVAWTKTVTVGSAQTDPYGGTMAVQLTGAAADSVLYTTVIPSNASGFVVCCSVWARASSPGQTLSIGFLDAGFATLGQTTWELLQGQWRRIHHTMTLGSDSLIRVLIGGQSTWGSGNVIDLFSAQCSPMPGPGPRLLTPGMDGLRSKCRFDTDDFVVTKNGLNDNSVTLPIAEYR